MGDIRFLESYERIRDSANRARELRSLSDEAIIGALAAASRELDPLMANVLATEAMNRARRAKAIAASIAEGVLTIDVNGRISYANPMAERLLGLPREELVGRPIAEGVRPFLPNGVPLELDKELDALLRQTDRPIDREDVLFTRSDGERFPVSCSMSVVHTGDIVAGVVVAFRDITDRKDAEQRVRDTWERYRLLAENITDIVIVADADGNAAYISPSCRHILHREPQDLVGARWKEHIHPDDLQEVRRVLDRREPGRAWNLTFRMQRLDGTYVWLEHTARDVSGDKGGPSMVAVARDVTHQKEAEAALRASEERYRLLADNIIDLVTLSDESGRIVYASPSAGRVLGYEPEEIVGKRLEELAEPDHRDAIRELNAHVRSGQLGPWVLTTRFRHANQKARWVEATIRAVHPTHEPSMGCVVSVFRDATARVEAEKALRESEARYRLLAEHSNDMLCTSTPDGELTFVSNAARRILGYDPSELVGRRAFDLLHPADITDFVHERARLLESTRGRIVRFRIRRKDGSYVRIESSEGVIVDEHSRQPRLVVGICRDASQR